MRPRRLPSRGTPLLRPCHHHHHHHHHHDRRTYAVQAPGTPAISVFNPTQKTQQRARAARDAPTSRKVDYLRDEIARRLVTRLRDIDRRYTRALDYGANACHVARALATLPDADEPDPDGVVDDNDDSSRPVLLHHPEQQQQQQPTLAGRVGELVCVDACAEMLHRDVDVPFFNNDTGKEDAGGETGGMRVTRQALPHPEALPAFEPESFDLILSSQSLHWVNDLPSLLAHFHGLLRPDRAFMAAMPGGDTLYELRGSLQLAEQERLGGVKQHVSPFADVRDVGNLLNRAGFKLLTVDVDDVVVGYPDLVSLVRDLNAMGEGNASLRMERGPIGRDTLMAAEGIYRELYGEEDGSLPATFRTVYMIGWKEGEGQSRPLERGSGEINLKGFLEQGNKK